MKKKYFIPRRLKTTVLFEDDKVAETMNNLRLQIIEAQIAGVSQKVLRSAMATFDHLFLHSCGWLCECESEAAHGDRDN